MTLVALAIWAPGLDALASATDARTDTRVDWMRTESQPATGVAMIVHGLNTKTQKMSGIGSLLNKQGIDVLLVTLSGHSDDPETMKQVSRVQWLKDFSAAYRIARAEADQHSVPLYFVGFSLSGALGIDSITESDERVPSPRFDKMILLAPAISVRSFTYLVNLLQIAGPQFSLPSMNHPDYLARPGGTTMAAYRGLFDSIESLERKNLRAANVPTLVLVDPDDELVNMEGLRSTIDRKHLNQWRLVTITTIDSDLSPSYHHLIIDRASLGPRVWDNVAAMITAHLRNEPIPETLEPTQLCATAKAWQTSTNARCTKDWQGGCDRQSHRCTKILERR